MDRVIAGLWVDALRSDRYCQTAGVLRGPANGNPADIGFCCLGVLCDLHRVMVNKQTGESTARWDDEEGYQCGRYSSKAVLPENVARWAGVDSYNPKFLRLRNDGHETAVYLSEMNDAGKSFEEIADAIEGNVDSL